MSASVIIPAVNEARTIGAAIDSAFAAGAAEVLLCDGASDDDTARVAAAHGARVLGCERHRARQLNRGAAEAQHETLLFLHADTLLPPNAIALAETALDRGAVFGGFRLRFAEPDVRLRIAERLINLRVAISRCPWGDQAQFVRATTFRDAGGFRDLPLMEDYDVAIRMKRRGRVAIVPEPVTTSGRRFLRKGLLRTSFMNWRIILAFRLGVGANRLAQWYRR